MITKRFTWKYHQGWYLSILISWNPLSSGFHSRFEFILFSLLDCKLVTTCCDRTTGMTHQILMVKSRTPTHGKDGIMFGDWISSIKQMKNSISKDFWCKKRWITKRTKGGNMLSPNARTCKWYYSETTILKRNKLVAKMAISRMLECTDASGWNILIRMFECGLNS